MQRQQRGWGFFGHSIKSTRYLAYIHSHTKDRTYKVVMGGGGIIDDAGDHQHYLANVER